MNAQCKKLLFGLALGLALAVSAVAQETGNVGTVLRKVYGGNPGQSKVPFQNSWSLYSPGSLNINFEVTGSTREAEWKLSRSLISTSVSHDRKEVFNGRTLYVWAKYGFRLSYQTGPYVIHVSGRGGPDRSIEPLARSTLESLVRELESLAPKRQVLRARDLPPTDQLASSWGAQGDFFRERNPEVIPWEDAEFILIDRKLQGGKQYHTRWLTIVCTNGDTFLTRQPEIDAYVQVGKTRSVDLTGFASE